MLLELLISITILSTTLAPISLSPLFYNRRQKTQLISLELERKAELIFYDILQEAPRLLALPPLDINAKVSKKPIKYRGQTTLDLSTLGSHSIPYHAHLYSYPSKGKKRPYTKIWCTICFEHRPNECSLSSHSVSPPFVFLFIIKNI